MVTESFNLLYSTIEYLNEHDKKTSDVLWVGNSEYWTTWSAFAKVAKDLNPNTAFSDINIMVNSGEDVDSLYIVGDNWWLERHAEQGYEWWEFKTYLIQPDKYEDEKKDMECASGIYDKLVNGGRNTI